MTSPVCVVGAGAAGLGAAAALAEHGSVTIVDRIPVPGGTAGDDRPDVHAWASRAARAGVRFLLGATALRWEGRRLLVCAPGDIGWQPAAWLVFAGGLRPATAAELGVVGDRPAGVLPVSVGKHLLEAEPALWRRVVLLGDGPGTGEAAALVAAGGGSLRRVPVPGPAVSVVGRSHVEAVRADDELIPCDAVLLGGDPRPVRNVDGAVVDGAEGVTFLQDAAPMSFDEAARKAYARAQQSAADRRVTA